MSSLLVFTDLDGTLLDHDNYSWAPATAALERLRQAGVPVIFNSSKTAAEQIVLRKQIGNEHPFVVENGAAVYVPRDGGYEIKRFGADRVRLIELARRLRQERSLRFEGFSDWTPRQLASVADLPGEMAALALDRCCSEPLLWQDDEASLHWFQKRIEDQGLRLVRGGRFFHLMGRFDKSEALGWLRRRYASESQEPVTIALGDSPNDADMLDAANIAVVVHSAKSDQVRPTRPRRVLRTTKPGPEGWQEAMDALLSEFGLDKGKSGLSSKRRRCDAAQSDSPIR